MTWLSRGDRNLAISDDVTATFGLSKAHKDAVLSHRTAVLGMTAFGAKQSTTIAPGDDRLIIRSLRSFDRSRPMTSLPTAREDYSWQASGEVGFMTP